MAPALHHLQDRTGDAVAALDRLINVGDAAQHDRARSIARLGKLLFQEFRRIGLYEQLGLEIYAGRQTDIGVVRPRVAVRAAMLAAAVRIDRLVKGNVRTLIAADDGL